MKKVWKLLKKNKIWLNIIGVFLLILTGVSIYSLYSLYLLKGIETFLRICGSIAIVIIWIVFILMAIRILLKKKNISLVIYSIILLIYIGSLFLIAININEIYSKVDNISSNYTLYSTSLVTLKDDKAESIKDIGNSKIGILSDENSVDGYQIPKNIAKSHKLDNELVSYDSFITLINALLDEEISYVFLPTNYIVMFKSIEGFEEIETETKMIYTEELKVKKKNISRNTAIDKPFTVLLMGVDSEKENIKDSSFNGDALILLTFNPTTLNTTILSIPRDTYVPIACFDGNRKNKITHAAWYGEECMIETIENFTGIDINYYLKINFKGVVKLVDSLGGIDVDVPIDFCEQDSNRDYNNEICLSTGEQTLNGEEALALSRHRHTINDFVRGQNQQLVVRALMNKAKDIRNLDTLYKLLDTISNNMETNMSTNEILSFYNIGKDILSKSKDSSVDDLLGMQRLYISGYDKTIYDYSTLNNQGTGLRLYNFLPFKGSIADVVKAMKINLGLEKTEMIKTFSFSINDPYEEMVIGKANYNESSIALLPNFIGQNKDIAINYGKNHGIKVNVTYESTNNVNYRIGQIINQDIPSDIDISYVKTINIKVVDKINAPKDDPDETPNCSLEENEDNSLCELPDFIGQNYSVFNNWKNKYNYSIVINITELKVGDIGYDASKAGKVIYQSKSSGTSIYSLIDNSLDIKYIGITDEEETD